VRATAGREARERAGRSDVRLCVGAAAAGGRRGRDVGQDVGARARKEEEEKEEEEGTRRHAAGGKKALVEWGADSPRLRAWKRGTIRVKSLLDS